MSEDDNEDPIPRPRRTLKVLMLSSSSDSDSDESVGPSRTRKKRLRVVSDEEASTSDTSEIICAGTRRKLKVPTLRDSEAESDSSGWASEPVQESSKPTSGFASDSSEGNSDKCSICLLRFKDQEIGTPQNCEHIFCLDCITEWSKNVNTCPVDRSTFNSIVVRAHIGGRVLRVESVHVVEHRPSIEMLVEEDPTPCQICDSTEEEDTMLLCDDCDLGYHMQCLTPALTEVPSGRWFCPNCTNNRQFINDVFYSLRMAGDMMDFHSTSLSLMSRRNSTLNGSRRSLRNQNAAVEPSTSTGSQGFNVDEMPTTSRTSQSRSSRNNNSRATTRRRATGTQRRKRRAKPRTVLIEYEIQENRKFPITKRIKRKAKKRKIKRRLPRTAARRSHVRSSVRAQLVALRAGDSCPASSATAAPRRRDAPVTRLSTLSVFGDPNQLDYFSDDDQEISQGPTAAVAARPTSHILNTFRQARRKMISIPSPEPATSAPDVLSNILESQMLLHSKNSIVSVSIDGQVNIKLDKSENKNIPKRDDDNSLGANGGKLDLSKSGESVKAVPSYPGQSRGGGWGGGYRGNYHREQGSNNFNNRGPNYDNNYGGNYQNRQGNTFHQNNMWREEADSYGPSNYHRRPHQYSHAEEPNFDRTRRQSTDMNRGPNNYPYNQNQRVGEQQRHSLGPTWPPFGNNATSLRHEHQSTHRQSFGGFENPLDMRMGQPPQGIINNRQGELFAPRQDKSQSYQPLPEPPVFSFDKMPEVEKSEDEKSDSGLVIDTDKYDPTEPTHDDDSGDEDKNLDTPEIQPPSPVALATPSVTVNEPAQESSVISTTSETEVQNIIAGLDTTSINVPPNVLDDAVRQVLQEHRNLIVPSGVQSRDKSDEDSDGDCPNFSIYSATSVHIASATSDILQEVPVEQHKDNLEDLVQEDDDMPMTPEDTSDACSTDKDVLPEKKPKTTDAIITSSKTSHDISIRKKFEEEYKEKVSKRCPITTNTRNPIKIKINTPSLIKRHVSLYDEEDVDEIEEPVDNSEGASELVDEKSTSYNAMSDDNIHEAEEGTLSDNNELNKGNEHDEYVRNVEKDIEQQNSSPERDKSPLRDKSKSPSPQMEIQVEKDIKQHEDVDSEEQNVDKTSDKSENEEHSDEDKDEISDNELEINSQSSKKDMRINDETVEKMTESISETEDERSYTPCLDENKSKDTSFETEKDKGIEGLDTEMISEDEGNEMFSDEERPPSEISKIDNTPAPPGDGEEGEILDKKKDKKEDRDEGKKKKKKENKKEGKDKTKSKSKKTEIAFKKLSKSGKERNYRERDRDEKARKRDRRDSSSEKERKQKRKEKRKDLERYDVRTVVSEKRRKPKDPFGRDVSPRPRSRSASRSSSRGRSPSGPRRSGTPARRRVPAGAPAASPERRRVPRKRRRSARSGSPVRVRKPEPRRRRSVERERKRPRRSLSASPRRVRREPTASPKRPRPSPSPKPKPTKKKKRSRSERPTSRVRRRDSPRRKSPRRRKVRRRSVSRSPPSMESRPPSPRTPPPEPVSPPPPSPPPEPLAEDGLPRRRERRRRRDLMRHRRLRDSGAPSKEVFTSGDNILVSVSFKEQERVADSEGEERRRREARRERRRRRRRAELAAMPDTAKPVAIIDLERSPFRELTPSPKNVIVLSDSDRADDEPERAAAPLADAPPPPAGGPKTPPEPAAQVKFTIAGKPASTARAANPLREEEEPGGGEGRGPATPPSPPRSPDSGRSAGSPDAYDPFEPTRSASASPERAPPAAPAAPPDPPLAPTTITLETAQKTNLSADDVLDRRPFSPIEKVMALLQSTRDVSPEPPPESMLSAPRTPAEGGADPHPPQAPAPAPATATVAPSPANSGTATRIVLPSPTRAPPPKLFLAKPSPIKSNPIKPMQAAKLAKPAAAAAGVARRGADDGSAGVAGGESPYSPGSSDFGDLFEPPSAAPPPPTARRDVFDSLFGSKPLTKHRRDRGAAAKVPVKLNRKRGKTQVGVKIDEDNLKILDDLPSSAVEMQVKSKVSVPRGTLPFKFLKKLNRQERVVEEVKLVLKPHYNKKHVTKDEYKDILRRAVPKICHNKSGEINPTKIQALVEAYVKKFRKKHKLGLA